MGTVRPLERKDLQDVANLLMRAFRGTGDASSALVTYLGDLFIDFPDRDPEINALVNVDPNGRITAFIGLLSQTMEFEGRTLRAAMANSFAADRLANDPMGPGMLLKAFINGPQDLSLSDRANSTSVAMWRSLKAPTLPLHSLDWLKVLHPASHLANRILRPDALRRAALPALGAIDRRLERRAAAAGKTQWSIAPAKPLDALRVEDAGQAEFAAVVPELFADVPLRPVWTPRALDRVLTDATQKSVLGETVRQIVRTKAGGVVGAYFYHVRKGGMARVLQILHRKGQAGVVIDCLLADAAARGAVAIGGRAQPALLDFLMDRDATFSAPHRSLAHSRDPEILAAINRGDAILTGLVGEYWIRLNDDGLS